MHVRLVDCPDIISKYFGSSNCVGSHNQARQYETRLKKKRETKDPWFRLSTMLIGINAVDTWKLTIFHKLFSIFEQKHNAEQRISMVTFSRILSKQLIIMAR